MRTPPTQPAFAIALAALLLSCIDRGQAELQAVVRAQHSFRGAMEQCPEYPQLSDCRKRGEARDLPAGESVRIRMEECYPLERQIRSTCPVYLGAVEEWALARDAWVEWPPKVRESALDRDHLSASLYRRYELAPFFEKYEPEYAARKLAPEH